MTIVVTTRVTDGLVMASDSATTFSNNEGVVMKVYNNANKVFNLVKVWPLGAMTYGSGSIGAASISTLSKDLRILLDPMTSLDPDMSLDGEGYTVEEVAIKARRFLFEQRYRAQYPDGVPNFYMGYRIGGYSAGAALPEVWEFIIIGNECANPVSIYDRDSFGLRWAGQGEALDRLILGCGSDTHSVLVNAGHSQEEATTITKTLYGGLCAPLSLSAMPIQDAIDLTYFLADTAAKFSLFSLNAPTVGGAIDVATITKHEGFKWIQRKHFYNEKLNRQIQQ